MESERRLVVDDYSTGAAPWHADGLKNKIFYYFSRWYLQSVRITKGQY